MTVVIKFIINFSHSIIKRAKRSYFSEQVLISLRKIKSQARLQVLPEMIGEHVWCIQNSDCSVSAELSRSNLQVHVVNRSQIEIRLAICKSVTLRYYLVYETTRYFRYRGNIIVYLVGSNRDFRSELRDNLQAMRKM